jgi:helix-turn-helix protein
MSEDDVLFGYRLRVLDHAARTSVSEACRVFGIHRSTYDVWKRRAERHGLEILRPRERRRPRMPQQLSPFVEERIVAFALGHPGYGPKRIASELRQERWGGILVGRLTGTKGSVWQLTAIDVASAFGWAELVSCPNGNPTDHYETADRASHRASWSRRLHRQTRRSHTARAGSSDPGRTRSKQRRDRWRDVPQRGDRKDPCQPRAHKARPARRRPGSRLAYEAGVVRPGAIDP